ncbi:hypothetical protein HELRODRAFT_181388 [Helobdella robusta]|uniref:HTH La-type RNA-binding domain-containing protein n=1 Tax=Helobdella robusta TaxID=6412 RepID=T1FGY4_HELRO|nr:hypothetical protein HELRODRAFT_181388 [Helobdella robusta]ESN92513.1 hypothetical protein HELRODRAFT_181388 [Helobdella robusta]
MTGLNEMMNNSCTVCNVLHTVNNHSENEDDHILHSSPNFDKHVCNCSSNIDEHVHNCSSSNVNEHVQNCSPDDELTSISNDELNESFSKDKFLISQLDSDQYISLDIVVQLRRISQFTTDVKLIARILEEFPNLQMDASGSKVRLIIPRSTIILRDVPQSTPKQAIEKLFDIDGSAPAVNCEYAGNQNWYINFASEQQARAAYHHLRQNVQTFLDQPIKVFFIYLHSTRALCSYKCSRRNGNEANGNQLLNTAKEAATATRSTANRPAVKPPIRSLTVRG